MSAGEGLLSSLRRQRFTVLLAALSLLFILAPLLRIMFGEREGTQSRGLLTLGFLAVLVARVVGLHVAGAGPPPETPS